MLIGIWILLALKAVEHRLLFVEVIITRLSSLISRIEVCDVIEAIARTIPSPVHMDLAISIDSIKHKGMTACSWVNTSIENRAPCAELTVDRIHPICLVKVVTIITVDSQ